ncbi:putative T7SS-secreted protein [Amycolatopsis sp. lyj-112]|uniref:putative T7SS-secreted protein n=1 Tax=Amycolatopsis sp. lyj-112 TaxID=2789288 RepID=UPI00397E8276
MTALGQTTDPRQLVPGEPEKLTNDLRRVVGNIKGMDVIGTGLGKLDPAEWTGSASNAFRSAFGAEPARWGEAIDAFGKGGQSLADFGEVLAWGQGEAQRAIELYTQAQAASRVAATRYDALSLTAQASGQPLAPFEDPGAEGVRSAQAIVDNARKRIDVVGNEVARKLGFEPDGKGGFKKKVGSGKKWGTESRKTYKEWDPKTGKLVDKDPNGWQRNKGGISFRYKAGSTTEKLFTEKLEEKLADFGIDLPTKAGSASGEAEVWGKEAEGSFRKNGLTGDGKVTVSALGAGYEADVKVTPLGVTAGVKGEAYLGKVTAEGELRAGEHISLSGKGEASVGAEGEAKVTVGPLGAQGNAEVFIGAKAEGDIGAEVAGVKAGAHGEAWAGAGAQIGGQFGLGDDGKFHVGGSLGIGLGVGGKVSFDMSVDPGEVVDTVSDVAKDVGKVADSVGDGAREVGQSAEKAFKGIGRKFGF